MFASNTALLIGTRIRLISMQDPYPLKPGSLGTITGRDDLGDLEVTWDCGSHLKLIPGVDLYTVLTSSAASSTSAPQKGEEKQSQKGGEKAI